MYPQVPLAEVLIQNCDYIDAPEPRMYPKLSVKLYGRGVTLDEPADGSLLKMKRHQLARPGQVILSEIWGKKGAIGIVPPEGDGALCTSHFFLFDPVLDRIDLGYLRAIFAANYLEAQLGEEARGTTGYAATRPKHLLQSTIPLPPLSDQRRIVARVEELATKIEEARGLRRMAAEELTALLSSVVTDAFPKGCSGTTVRDFARVQSGYAFRSEWFSPDGVRLARNANIGHGALNWNDTVYLAPSRKAEFSRFELFEGDILVSLDRPIISTGVKVARVAGSDLPALLLQRVGRLQFVDSKVVPEYMFAWLRSPIFVSAIDPGRSNGVPHISPKDIERIPFSPPNRDEQRRIVTYLNDLEDKVNSLKRLQTRTAAELDALLPTVLDRAFRGEL